MVLDYRWTAPKATRGNDLAKLTVINLTGPFECEGFSSYLPNFSFTFPRVLYKMIEINPKDCKVQCLFFFYIYQTGCFANTCMLLRES